MFLRCANLHRFQLEFWLFANVRVAMLSWLQSAHFCFWNIYWLHYPQEFQLLQFRHFELPKLSVWILRDELYIPSTKKTQIKYLFGFRQIGHQDSSTEKFCSFAKVLSYFWGWFVWCFHGQNRYKIELYICYKSTLKSLSTLKWENIHLSNKMYFFESKNAKTQAILCMGQGINSQFW